MNTPTSGVVGLALATTAFALAAAQPKFARNAQLLPFTRSTIDDKPYRVMPGPNAVDAANQLCRIKQSVQQILHFLSQYPKHPGDVRQGVVRLLQRHPNADSINMVELHHQDAEHTLAFNEGKGTIIFLCMRQKPPSDKLGPDDVLLYIVLHELAHNMDDRFAPTTNEGHTVHDESFRRHNEYLNDVANRLGLLRPGSIPGQSHCGVIMPDPEHSI